MVNYGKQHDNFGKGGENVKGYRVSACSTD